MSISQPPFDFAVQPAEQVDVEPVDGGVVGLSPRGIQSLAAFLPIVLVHIIHDHPHAEHHKQ